MMRSLFLCCILLAGGCATVGRDVPGIENLATVDPAPDALYRGGQPSRRGVETLRRMGVKTVIDLRNDPTPWERRHVTAAGMKYVHVPTDARNTDPIRIAQFLLAVRTSDRPIFVHCKRGRDRTGLEIAVYRMVDQSEQWTREAAIAELRRHGHQWFAFPGIERYLARFDPAGFTSAALHAGARVGTDDDEPQGN